MAGGPIRRHDGVSRRSLAGCAADQTVATAAHVHRLLQEVGVRPRNPGGGEMKSQRVCNGLAWCLLVTGLLQMAGDLVGSRLLRGIGAVTAMAPYTKVFSDMNGIEPFASTFTL